MIFASVVVRASGDVYLRIDLRWGLHRKLNTYWKAPY